MRRTNIGLQIWEIISSNQKRFTNPNIFQPICRSIWTSTWAATTSRKWCGVPRSFIIFFQCWTHHNIQLQTFIPWTKNLFQIWVCLWHQGYAHASSGTPTGVSVCGVSCTTRIWKNGLHPFLWGSWQTSSSPLWSPVCVWVSRHTCGPPQLTKKENLWRRMSCQGASTMQFQKHMVIWFKPIPISPSQYVSSAGASRSICDSSVAVVLTSSCMISVPIPPRDAVLKPLIAACLVWLQVLNSGHLSEELEKQFLNYTISVNLILK